MQFFMTIMNKYLIRDPMCKDLVDIASSIFDWERNLHQRVYQSYNSSSNELAKQDFDMSETAKRVESERNWRCNELKVGDTIDVIKPALIRDLVLYSWSRGTVVFKGIPEDEVARDVSASPSSN